MKGARFIVAAAAVTALVGCAGSSDVGATPEASATPEAQLCDHLRDLRSLMSDLLDGTVTHDEAVTRLTEAQADFEQDTEILEDQGAPKAAVVERIAIGVGRLKVAMDNAGTEFMASTPVTEALYDLADPLGDVLAC